MFKRILYITIIMLSTGYSLHAQDPHFSQFFSSPLYLSPSLAGTSNGTRLITNYRNQWPAIANSYVNYAFSADHFLTNYNSGIGLLVLQSNEGGVFNKTDIGANYTYNIKINPLWSINPGLRFSYSNATLDWNALEFGDQIYRGSSTSVELRRGDAFNYFDFTTSILVYSKNVWFGVTADHLLNINSQLSEERGYPPLKYTVYGGTKFIQNSRNILTADKSYTVAFLFKQQSNVQQLDIGTYHEREFFRLGLWLRGSRNFQNEVGLDAITFLTGFNYNQLKFNYSYDISAARLMTLTGGAHEISMMYVLSWDGYQKKSKRRMVPCPEF